MPAPDHAGHSAPGVRRRNWLVTGTDTGIGKTFVCTALLAALRAQRLRAVGMKPVASGCMATADGWRNEDALALQAASEPRPAYADVNPFALPAATAPQLAARDAGVHVSLASIRNVTRTIALFIAQWCGLQARERR